MYEKFSISQTIDSTALKKVLRLSYAVLIKLKCSDKGSNSLPGLCVY